ncbi:hypothetical protein MMAD_05780 [Mycolicibacterium madagascariense]|uniref:ANTAR domain-containing protein n=1 Tax=Mycolicibacterium madagascariense TaxID=212765 RepID=A0A7I7XBG7_9MYCO|nr:GAF and ANTAR domain-containing protein [Mycolicibacterium madagascariense]MCV7011864.1 GAF and ANTAR domain-containing protein [Mycolicibacterium madagascariense]BBZ26283.1 hypothetical protein MMAD_05780 [Mycolicibacterium madagascariense]
MAANEDDASDQLVDMMVELAKAFPRGGEHDLDDTLGAVVQVATDLIDRVAHASVLLVDEHGFRSVAPSDEVATELDRLQIAFGEGPCVQAATEDPIVVCSDLRDEPRFPQFAAAAVDRGVLSMLACQLYTHPGGGAGALNLFAATPSAFPAAGQSVAAMLATHAATALTARDAHGQFTSALASRDRIAQAKGIIMERFQLDAVAAFDMLRKLSQDLNTPLRQIAARVIDTINGPTGTAARQG